MAPPGVNPLGQINSGVDTPIVEKLLGLKDLLRQEIDDVCADADCEADTVGHNSGVHGVESHSFRNTGLPSMTSAIVAASQVVSVSTAKEYQRYIQEIIEFLIY
jgi:hypothetical protein